MHESRTSSNARSAGSGEPIDPLPPEPDPRRLRLGCLLVYAGLLLSLAGLFSAPVASADGQRLYHTVQHWDVDDGLEQNTVRAITFDATGYLWLGTVDGLSRFDGVRFRNFRLFEYPALGSNRIRALAATADGAVWIGTGHRGLVRFRDGEFVALPLCDQSCQVSAISVGPDGGLWVLSSIGLHRVDPASGSSQLHLETGAPALDPGSMAVLGDGRVALATGARVRVLDSGGGTVAERSLGAEVEFRALGEYRGRLVAVTGSGVLDLDADGPAEPLGIVPEAISSGRDPVRFATAIEGGLVMQTGSGRVFRLSAGPDPAGSGTHREAIELQRPVSVISALAGNAGDLWLGTRLTGLIRVSPSRVFGRSGFRDGGMGSVLPIVDHPESGVIVGRVCGGLVHIDNGDWRPLRPEGDEVVRCVWSLLSDADGSVLIGGYSGGVQRLRAGRVETLSITPPEAAESRANFMIPAAAGHVWLGSAAGLFRIERGRIEAVDGAPPGIPLLSGLERADGSLLLGTGSGLYQYDGSAFARLQTGLWIDALPVRSILERPDGALLFGTYGGGLWRLHQGEWLHVGPGDGLPEDVISCMLADRRGRLWTSGNHGVSTLELAQLDALAAGQRERLRAWSLTEDDGLPNAETNGGGHPACHADRHGRLWFPTVAGPVAFDPEAIGRFVPDGRVLIESAHLDGRPLAADGPLLLPVDARNLEIRYTVPQFENAHRLRFRYRLAGIDEQWVVAGPRRTVTYPVLPAGQYRFEVQLGVDDGRWLDSTAAIELRRPAPGIRLQPWQIGVGAGCLLALLAFLRWRILSLHRRDAELNAIIERRTAKLREMNQRLDQLSRTDELTGIANHRRLRAYLENRWKDADEDRSAISIIVLDVDRFKAFNDALGHPAGDRLLHALAQSLSRRVAAEGGLLARYGGEEFVAVLPGRTLGEAEDVAESLRRAVVSLEFKRPGSGNGFVTASFGVASAVPEVGSTAEDLIQRADRAMYAAKRAGRNRVVTEAG